jgi:hypothetical protein
MRDRAVDLLQAHRERERLLDKIMAKTATAEEKKRHRRVFDLVSIIQVSGLPEGFDMNRYFGGEKQKDADG